MYAFVSVDEDGDEGIYAISHPTQPDLMLPMVGADMERVEHLKNIADEMELEYTIKTFSLDSI